MNPKEHYTKQVQNQMEKYKDKLSKIDDLLNNTNSQRRSELLSQRENLQDKFDKAEKILKEITASSDENYEKIKDKAVEVFDDVKEAFHEFSSFLTMEQLYRTKEEIIDFSNDKLEEIETFVKKRPITIAACAIGIGFLIGTLLTRSK
jgi:ElaB/YqjD/DUF883 family membrane-anchored ribosome-binding protein